MALHLNLPPAWGGTPLPVHAVLEAAAYFGGYQLYRRFRGREPDPVSPAHRLAVIVAAALGALIGSKLPGIWTALSGAGPAPADSVFLPAWLGGKTLVGGIVFAWLAVEATKKFLGIKVSTGDAFIFPLLFAMVVGRLGCFLAGVADGTQGVATALPWAVDYGDGIPRHPSPLYEILFLLAWGSLLWALRERLAPGARFKVFLLGYFPFRLAGDFLKPDPEVALGLSSVQWTSILGLLMLAWQWNRYGGIRKGEG
jgi:phosphatidylglycerol---prolipoprotein diacylglyceryl transferase